MGERRGARRSRAHFYARLRARHAITVQMPEGAQP
jgi:hypothetical protein